MSSGCAPLWLVRRKSCRPELCRTAYSSTFGTRDPAWVLTGISSWWCAFCSMHRCASSTGACPCLGRMGCEDCQMGYFLERRAIYLTPLSHTHGGCLWAGPQSVLSIQGPRSARAGWGRASAVCRHKSGGGPAGCEVGLAEQDASDEAADADQPDLGWKESVSEKQSPRTHPLRVKTAGLRWL